MEKKSVLVCVRVKDASGHKIEDTTEDVCMDCGEAILLAPNSHTIIQDNPGIEILCNECAFTKMKQAIMGGDFVVPMPFSDEKKETDIMRFLLEGK